MNNEPNVKIRKELIKIFKSRKLNEIEGIINSHLENFPKSIFLLSLLGNVNSELGNYNEAIINFEKIIEIDPHFSEAYYNLGVVYKNFRKIDNAIKNYEKCIKIDPNNHQAYNNLGNIYKDKEKNGLAIEKYLQCLKLNPDYEIALQNFGVCLQNFKFSKQSISVEKNILNLLDKDNILRPVDIIDTLISYLYLDETFNIFFTDIENIKKYSLDNIISKFLDNKILMKLLKITPITDTNIENSLIFLRYFILLKLKTIKNKNSAIILLEAIASQCFINEYIYYISKEEEKLINLIENKIKNQLSKSNGNDFLLEILCLASYKPLHKYNWSDKILNIKEIEYTITQQIKNYIKEAEIGIKLLSKEIKNSISIAVKNQYENNPYPRWEKIALNRNPYKPINFFNNLNLNINENINHWKDINVLVAGCGTGQHAITTAKKFERSFVTAIDLSSKSLSYAKRKAGELNIQNIEFIQIDIIDIMNLKKNFHIIESVGVLHHMDNPLVGWKNLYNVLHSNGLMMIGLYSRFARKHIQRFREEIINSKLEINSKNIKTLREKILISNTNDDLLIKNSTDFYSLSNLRDLLFHVKEHTFTIPEINEYLNKLNLDFCGFENREILSLFSKIYKNKNDIFNLKHWHNFEINNPRVFAGMYQFWCQKNI